LQEYSRGLCDLGTRFIHSPARLEPKPVCTGRIAEMVVQKGPHGISDNNAACDTTNYFCEKSGKIGDIPLNAPIFPNAGYRNC
jgi:hypothetical protein